MNKKTANKKYNPNSAITHLQRMGKSIQGAACIDNVSLTYSGNKLNTAQDTGISASMMGDAFHFVDGDDYYSGYGYDTSHIYRYIMDGDPITKYQGMESEGTRKNVHNYTHGKAHDISTMINNISPDLHLQ